MKISELTENDVIHIRNKKEAKHVWRLLRKEGFSWHDLGTNTWKTFKECYKQCFNAMCINYFDRCYSDISTYKGRNIIPASKFLNQSISKKDLQEALSKVGEELSSMNERLGKLEVKSDKVTAINNVEVHFDEVTEGLPEKWCVLRTPTNHKLINKWAGSQWGEAYYFEPTEYLNSDASTSDTKQDGYTEITFETFKKYVLKEEVKETQPEAIDFSKAGQLVESDVEIVMTTGDCGKDVFSGVLISKTHDNNVRSEGYTSTTWNKCAFKLYEGSLTLQN